MTTVQRLAISASSFGAGAEVALPPIVVEGTVIWSSLDSEPPPDSPMRGTRLRWTPTSRDEIAASIAACRRRWWRR